MRVCKGENFHSRANFLVLLGAVGCNIRARLLLIFVIGPDSGARVNLCDSMTVKHLTRVRKFPNPPGSSAVEIFAHDRFPSLLIGLIVVFARFRNNQTFGTHALLRKFPYPSRSAPVVTFARNRIQSLSFGLIVVSVRFRDRKTLGAHVRVRKFPGPPGSAPVVIFARSLHIFVIWPN